MNTLIKKLTEAQKYAMSIKPKVGGFPVLAEVLRQTGVKINRWSLPSCQSIYIFNEGTNEVSVAQQGAPLLTGTFEIPKFSHEALITALRTDQEGRSSFPEFLMSAWHAGVVTYEVDFINRKVTYYGVHGESYAEEYPVAELK